MNTFYTKCKDADPTETVLNVIEFFKSHGFTITEFNKEDANIFLNSNSDGYFENLWKTFYSSVNIKELENPKLRRQYMPKRYWNNLTELK